jgi:hypothetical protein
MHPVRVIPWTVAMAYTGFLLTGQGLQTFNSLSITEATKMCEDGVLGPMSRLFMLAPIYRSSDASQN